MVAPPTSFAALRRALPLQARPPHRATWGDVLPHHICAKSFALARHEPRGAGAPALDDAILDDAILDVAILDHAILDNSIWCTQRDA